MDASPTGLDQIWVADITDVRLAGQFAHLAVVLARRVIGGVAEHLEASLAIEALDMALAPPVPSPASSITPTGV